MITWRIKFAQLYMKDHRKSWKAQPAPRTETTTTRKTPDRKVPFSWFLVSLILLAGVSLTLVSMKFSNSAGKTVETEPVVHDESGFRQILNTDYRLVKPVVITEATSESQKLSELRMKISMLLKENENDGTLISSGVFLKRLNTGEWISFGNDEAFQAGSLLKVPIMITWLMMAQEDPSLLRKKLFFPQPRGTIPGQTYTGRSITPDRYYEVTELMTFMIGESDNNATYVLGQNMDVRVFQKLFTDLGLTRPELGDSRYSLTASLYSRFLDVLYHASVVNPKLSQLGLEMLTKCTFNKGLTKNLPADLVVAHKFGEQGIDGIAELSESGIFYYKDQPYLLTVMTKGADIDRLANVIGLVSGEVYQAMSH